MSLIGQTVGNYQVTRLLGEGGMGVVYQAEHPVIGRKVAIKLLHLSLAKDAEVVARFFNEARAIHTIRHENIVEIMDFGQTATGQPYFIMEFLGGEAMNDRLARGPMPPPQVAEIAGQICRALAAAHDKGIVHRDLKPHNVQLLTQPSGRIQAKLLDFGVAKIMNAADLSQSVKTRTGSLMGTPLYMSPEQCKGAGELDHRTDIYSLGVMLYEMLAGRPPFVAEGVGELFALHMLQQPPPLTNFAPDTPPAMVAAVMRALAKKPADRFASMEELRQAFQSDAPEEPLKGAQAGHTRRYRSQPGATLVVPAQQTSTTFSSAQGEVGDGGDMTPPRKSRAAFLMAAIALAAAGAGTYLVVVRGAGKANDGDPSRAQSNAALEPTAARESHDEATGTERPKADTPRPGKTVRIRFEAEPAGTHVFRVTDDKDLGAVPLELELPRGGNKPEYVLRHEGYLDRALSADLTSGQTLRATLEKIPAPPPPEPATPPPAPAKAAQKGEKSDRGQPSPSPSSSKKTPAPHRAHRPSSTGDEDGLATPSF